MRESYAPVYVRTRAGYISPLARFPMKVEGVLVEAATDSDGHNGPPTLMSASVVIPTEHINAGSL